MVDLITVDKENRVFHLHNEQLSYIFSIEDGDTISHLYFGKRVKSYHGQLRYPRVDRGFSGNLPGSLDRTFLRILCHKNIVVPVRWIIEFQQQ